MSSWIEAAADFAQRGDAYVLITVLGSRGSTPRDSGTKMLVGAESSHCTIGGGHLEYKAIEIARNMLAGGKAQQRIENFPLGARLGQCCGGSTAVLFECFAASKVNIMLFGAGHVGKALVAILQQLPCQVQWVDTREDQFPDTLAANVKAVVSDTPADEVASMPAGSYYIIMTHKHPLDYAITEAVLNRSDARYTGLIGSQTKWKRFQMRLQHRNFSGASIATIRCPVGLPAVPGKLPMEVATSIAAELIAEYQRDQPLKQTQQGVGVRELKKVIAPEDLKLTLN